MPCIDLQHNPEQAVIFVLENHSMLSLWNFVIYIFFGVLLTLLIIVLHQQVALDQPLLAQFSSAMGMVWVGLVIASGMLANVGLTQVASMASILPDLARSLWLSVITIKQGLGGSNENEVPL